MAKAQTHIKFTVEDYQHLPESETKCYQLLGGNIVMAPAPTPYHQDISRNLVRLLDSHIEKHHLGKAYYAPIDVMFSNEDVVQPDILFISRERMNIIQENGLHGAPDLIVEIFSPATADRDRTYKRTLYARSRVLEYWLVDPDTQTIEVLTLGKKDYQRVGSYAQDQTLNSPLLSGLAVPLNEIF